MKIDFTIKRKILRIDGSQRELIFEIAALYFLEFQVSHAQMFVHISKYAKKKIGLYIVFIRKNYRLAGSNLLIF